MNNSDFHQLGSIITNYPLKICVILVEILVNIKKMMLQRIFTAFIVCFLTQFTLAQPSVFKKEDIHTFEINFYDTNWDHLLDSLSSQNSGTGSGTGRILAEVIINGSSFDSCGVRYKGNSSLDTAGNKNPFNIDLNYHIPGQEYQHKDKFKLANCFSDPSMVREILMYEISNQYMDCPRASFVKLYINGNYRGIYTNTESIDNEFLDEFYGASNGPFFKCDPDNFELFGDNSNLAYQPDTTAYDTLYDMKSLWGTTALQTLGYQLENNPSLIEDYLDVDRALWFLALSSAMVHNDSYTAFAHNFYIYQKPDGIWSIILWDVNMSFGGLPYAATTLLTPIGLNEMITLDPFVHDGAPNFRPLIAKLLSIPQYRRMYIAHYKTIMEENVANGFYLQRADFYSDLISNDVSNEPYPQYTYQQFQNNIYTGYGAGWGFRPGIEELMEGRLNYIDNHAEFQGIPPEIVNIIEPTSPGLNTTVTLTAEINNATAVIFAYRYNKFQSYTKINMYDDGLHGDGGAGDNIYGVEVPLAGYDLQYYLYAENSNAAVFSPKRAAYEYHLLSPAKGLVINEVSALNNSIATDLSGEYDDWIEFYNNSDAAIPLNDYFLTDDPSNPLKWQLPNFSLLPNKYFIVWCDSNMNQAGVHANFKLKGSGESIYLNNISSQNIDQVHFPPQYEDITYGRLPNGSGSFNFLYPTFGAKNDQIVAMKQEENAQLLIYPSPVQSMLNIEFNDLPEKQNLLIYNIKGQLVQSETVNAEIMQINVSNLSPGTYLLIIGENYKKRFVKY